jgi:hypothetical protein
MKRSELFFFVFSITLLESYELLEGKTIDSESKITTVASMLSKGSEVIVRDKFIYLDDVPKTYVYNNYLMVNTTTSALVATSSVIANNTFLGLKDTPYYYSNNDQGSLIVSNSSMDGVHFEHQSFIHKRRYLNCTASFTYWANDLDGVDIRVSRAYAPFPITFDTGYNGADVCLYLVDDTSIPANPVTLYGQSCSIEDEPLQLNDTNRFVHLVFNQAVNKWQIVSYDKGV